MSWIPTYSGVRFDLRNPRVTDVRIGDIAHALANVCRFAGHTRQFYSVAQHSVLVSRIVPPQYALHGLLHDAAEAYIGDVTRPLKPLLMPAYGTLECGISAQICRCFDVRWCSGSRLAVKRADEIALATEARDLMAGDRSDWAPLPEPLAETIVPLSPVDAKSAFAIRFCEVYRPVLNWDQKPRDLAGAAGGPVGEVH